MGERGTEKRGNREGGEGRTGKKGGQGRKGDREEGRVDREGENRGTRKGEDGVVCIQDKISYNLSIELPNHIIASYIILPNNIYCSDPELATMP